MTTIIPVSNADLAAFIVALVRLREVVGVEANVTTFHEHGKPALWACCDEVKRRIEAGESMTETITLDDLQSQLSRAGAMVGPMNIKVWFQLVQQFGLVAVLAEVEAIKMDTRSPAVLTDTRKALEAIGAEKAQEEQYELEDEGLADPPPARPPLPPVKPAAAPAAPVPEAITPPSPKPPEPTTMLASTTALPTSLIKSQCKAVEDEIVRRGMMIKDAMGEMDLHHTAIYPWRKGEMSANQSAKIDAWLTKSRSKAAKPAAAVAAPAAKPTPAAKASSPPPKAPQAKEKPTPKPYGLTVAKTDLQNLSLAQLLARGDELGEALEQLGAEKHRETARALCDCLRRVSAAVLA